ncbi:MAG: hypothetical protein EBV03_04030 [Proteobacteria bacterium]|nr:hypothetical protein [Pseudomonadota bacterium]
MVGTRFFNGSRDVNKDSLAREILKIEKQKGGKLSSQERFKLIMQRKMAESKKVAENKNQRHMSKKAQDALKQVAMKKAAKEQKIMRQSVIVQKKIFNNGMVQKNGKIMDIAGNQIGQINKKNGKMSTVGGAGIGTYKANSRSVNAAIMGAIDKYSPYYINLRKMQAMQAQGLDPKTGLPLNQEAMNVHGNSMSAMHGGNYQTGMAGQMMMQQLQEKKDQGVHGYIGGGGADYSDVTIHGRMPIAGTAWGAMADNVWGNFSDNVHGTTGDNVWGTNSTDIWGGVGGDPWGGRKVRIWGTGDGVNRMKSVTKMIRKLFGKPSKKTVKAFNAFRKAGGKSGAMSAKAGPRPPVNTRRR